MYHDSWSAQRRAPKAVAIHGDLQPAGLPCCHKALQVTLVQVSVVQQEEADHCGALPQEQFRQAGCHLRAARCAVGRPAESLVTSGLWILQRCKSHQRNAASADEGQLQSIISEQGINLCP